MAWWHENYVYRRRLRVRTPPEDVDFLHPVVARVRPKSDKEDPLVLLQNGKVRQDLEDLEVIYINNNGEPIQIYREIDVDEEIQVTFQLQEDMAAGTSVIDRYYIYYGNLDLVSAPTRPGPIGGSIAEWPVTIPYNHSMITYTRPGESWQEGRSSERLARMSMRFWGTHVRLHSEVGPNQGIIEVQVDNSPWQLVDLYSVTPEIKSVYQTFGLSVDVPHELRVRVTGRRNASSTDVEANIQRVDYAQAIAVDDVKEEYGDLLLWAPSVGGI